MEDVMGATGHRAKLRMDSPPPLLPPGCRLQGRRTLHLDLDRLLAHLSASVRIATASSLIPAETAGQALRLMAVAREVVRRLTRRRRPPGRHPSAT